MKINGTGESEKTNPIKANISQLKPISMPFKPKQTQSRNNSRGGPIIAIGFDYSGSPGIICLIWAS